MDPMEKIDVRKEVEAGKIVKMQPPDPELVKYDRLTWVGHFTHQHWGEQPVTFPMRYDRLLEKNHQPIYRRISIPREGITLEKCLGGMMPIEDVGFIAIENRTGKGLMTHPTLEEKKQMKEMVLSVRYERDAKVGSKVPPGLPFVDELEDPTQTWLVSLSDQPININLYVFSK